MKGKALIHWIKCMIGVDESSTQTSIKEQHVLSKYAAKSKNIVEIGVFEGFNTKLMALASPESVLYAIDPFFKGAFGICYHKQIALNTWKRVRITHRIKVVEGLSQDVIHAIPEDIDFIFIDGDHSYEGVKRDFKLYSDKLSPTGLIALHDARIFDGGWTKKDWGPVQFVNDQIRSSASWDIVEEIDSLVIVKRK